jgi:pimeloyl-ACP methyl ester carboxylesterase
VNIRLLILTALVVQTAMSSAAPIKSGYAPVNGLQLYYEIHGPETPGQPPLVLLHGGGDTIGTSFAKILPLLARTRRVIAFEQQGFGHTADIPDRPFTFEQSADDTAALLAYLKIPHADLFGFSNGGTIALQVAMRHPKVVRRLVVITAIFRRSGVAPEFWAGMKNAKPEMMPKVLSDAYLAVAPHPEALESFFYKCAYRMRDFQDIPDDALRRITAPTLAISSDHDVMRPEHALELARLLPQGQAAIIPGAGHMEITSRTDVLLPMIDTFLGAAATPRKSD